MKKLGLFIALFSMMILTSCEKEDENTSSSSSSSSNSNSNSNDNGSLKERIVGTWDAEMAVSMEMNGVDFPMVSSTGKMTFNADGTGSSDMETDESMFGDDFDDSDDYSDDDSDEDDSSFTWSINSNDELIMDGETTMSNDVNEADKLEFSGVMEMEEEEEDMDMEDDMDFGLEITDAKITLKLSK